jgi:hypothetical protein
MCEWLEVSRSGYYDWLSRPESETAKRMALLKLKIKALFDANNEEYGYRRIHAALVRGGEQADDETVRKLMRELGLEPCQPRPWRHSLTEQGPSGPIPDLVNRDFTAVVPGAKMVGDITYIPTWEGWLYLATVIDWATRKIVGWAMDDNYKTPLISSAIRMAARNLSLPDDAIFHSDRGSNGRPCCQVEPGFDDAVIAEEIPRPEFAPSTHRWPTEMTCAAAGERAHDRRPCADVGVSSPSPSLPISAAAIACVPHSASAAIRTKGNALLPFFPAYPKYSALSSLSGASMPNPSTAIRRRPASQAPSVDRIA